MLNAFASLKHLKKNARIIKAYFFLFCPPLSLPPLIFLLLGISKLPVYVLSHGCE